MDCYNWERSNYLFLETVDDPNSKVSHYNFYNLCFPWKIQTRVTCEKQNEEDGV
jgi:hypothetical protein